MVQRNTNNKMKKKLVLKIDKFNKIFTTAFLSTSVQTPNVTVVITVVGFYGDSVGVGNFFC